VRVEVDDPGNLGHVGLQRGRHLIYYIQSMRTPTIGPR
jgi:hypothetical protein